MKDQWQINMQKNIKELINAIASLSKQFNDMQESFEDSVNRLRRSIRQNRNSIFDLEEYRNTNPCGDISMKGYARGYRSLQDSISEPKREEL
jgi:methyl-accepting chemotaxis protein